MAKMIFITGGVRSGKSAFAENYAKRLIHRSAYYIATGVAFDKEMEARINKHRQDRANQSIQWQTIEVKHQLPSSIQQMVDGDVVLFECVTTWLSNVFYHTEAIEGMARQHAIEQHLHRFQQQLLQWRSKGVTVLIVSNEVLDDWPSIYMEVELYKQLLGELHQWLVKYCDEAYEIAAQLVHQWK